MNVGFRIHISNLYEQLLHFQYYNNTEDPHYLGKLPCTKPANKTLITQKFFECTMKEDEFRELGIFYFLILRRFF